MAVVRKKQDDKNLKILRETVALGGNRQCFDCSQRGPTYVNMTIGSFVCTRCSGVLRGLTPPHRVKSISMATFTSEELEFIKQHGNDECAKTWLGLWDPKRVYTQDQRELIIDKYERKRYFLEPASPLKSLTTSTQLSAPSQPIQAAVQPPPPSQPVINKDTTSFLRTINLTPPTSLSLSRNTSKLNKAAAATLNAVTSNGNTNFKQQFTPDDVKTLDDLRLYNFLNNNAANSLSNGLINGTNHTNGLTTTRTSVDTLNDNHINSNNNSSSSNNKFTPDADFVADFNAANIFDSSSIATAAAKLLATNDNTSSANCNLSKLTNGMGTVQNGTTIQNANADFADFDHNPIYNASANQMNGSQWNIWQQFQWPFMLPEQNRWSLPMSLSSTSNSLNSSGTFNSNSSICSTPQIDRYAALKDLDDQFREVKEKDAFNVVHPTSNGIGINGNSNIGNGDGSAMLLNGANPFKQHQGAAQLSNPFQAQFHPTTVMNTNGGWPSMNVTSTTTTTTNDMGISAHNNLYNTTSNSSPQFFNNGAMNGGNRVPTMNNGFIAHHQPKNPFAASALNSNNPFL